MCDTKHPSDTMKLVLAIFGQADGILSQAGLREWMESLKRITRACALGCCHTFNAFCGGQYEPSAEKKRADFNRVLVNAAKTRFGQIQAHLEAQFSENIGSSLNRHGMQSKLFCQWISQLRSVNNWVLALSEEWRNVLDHGRPLHTPLLLLKLRASHIVTVFEAGRKYPTLSVSRASQGLLKLGIHQSAVAQIVTLFDFECTQRLKTSDVMCGLLFLCGDAVDVKLRVAMQVNGVDIGRTMTVQSVYSALKSFTAVAIGIAMHAMCNCSIFENDKKAQDVVARIVHLRLSMYLGSVASSLVHFVQHAKDAIDFSDLRRYLDAKTGLTKWFDCVGQRLAQITKCYNDGATQKTAASHSHMQPVASSRRDGSLANRSSLSKHLQLGACIFPCIIRLRSCCAARRGISCSQASSHNSLR